MATQKLFLDLSWVENRCDPHICVAEFTSQVECRPTTVRRKSPHIKYCQPPKTSMTTPKTAMGSQCHLLIQTWKLLLRRSGTYDRSSDDLLCIASPVMIQP